MTGRIVIISFLQGTLAPDGTLAEPDIDGILEKWLQRHPEFRGRKFHIIKTGGTDTCLVRVTTDKSPDLAAYDPAAEADLYGEFLAKSEGSPPKFEKIWIEQCEAARGIEDGFGTDKARHTEPFDPALYAPDEPDAPGVDYGDYERYEGEDPETIEMMRHDDIRECARDLLLVERAREWLLDGEEA